MLSLKFTCLIYLLTNLNNSSAFTESNYIPATLQAAHVEEPTNRALQSRRVFYESELFKKVQELPLFEDSKIFPDMIPRQSVKRILNAYEVQRDADNFDLDAFVLEYFDKADIVAGDEGKANDNETLKSYIERMWFLLERSFPISSGSLLALPKSAIVPGGRFREAYYWDSLFPYLVLLGDKDEKKRNLALNTLDNIAYMIRIHGYMPNGNRDYYLGRSQPPVLAMMLNSLFEKDPSMASNYTDALQLEFDFWTSRDLVDESDTPEGRTVVADERFPVQIYDSLSGSSPRPEAWKEDLKAMEGANSTSSGLYRNIRASCESGWDFTSRFAKECDQTQCLKTTEFAPIDLNSFIQHGARVLSKLYDYEGKKDLTEKYKKIADDKKLQINEYFWSDQDGAFLDREWRTGHFSPILTPASVIPLVFNLTDADRANSTLRIVAQNLLRRGGLKTSVRATGQQWDAPYGWAPLQYFFIVAALNYGHTELAKEVAARWLAMVQSNFDKYGRIFEKYDVETGEYTAHGGQYRTQAGFAFTNAVTYDIIEMLDYLHAGTLHKQLILSE